MATEMMRPITRANGGTSITDPTTCLARFAPVLTGSTQDQRDQATVNPTTTIELEPKISLRRSMITESGVGIFGPCTLPPDGHGIRRIRVTLSKVTHVTSGGDRLGRKSPRTVRSSTR